MRFTIPAGSSVLEIGCAAGDTLNAVCPSTGVGLDINPFLIEEAKKKYPGLQFHAMDVEDENSMDSLAKPVLSTITLSAPT